MLFQNYIMKASKSVKQIKSLYSFILRYKIKRPATSDTTNPRVLFVTYDAIGDMSMTIPLFNALQKEVPNWKLEVLASPRNYDIVKQHPAFQHVWRLDINRPFGKLNKEDQQELSELYKQDYDLLIYLGERISSAPLWRLSNIRAYERLSLPYNKKTTKKKGIDPLRDGLFDRYIGLSNEQEVHICRRMLSILPDLNITLPAQIDLSLQLPSIKLPSVSFSENQPRILFNPNGSRDNNTLSKEQVKELVEQLNALSCEVCLFDTIENHQLTETLIDTIHWLPSTNILMAAQWLNEIDLVVTTDTSIGHIAAAQSRLTIMMRTRGPNCCEPLSKDVQMLRMDTDNIKELAASTIIQAVKQKLAL
jgi:ADP-heptose:LPS heptosyltransferase